MGRTGKRNGKTKTTKRQHVKDLSPKDSKQVKGGDGPTFNPFSITRKVDKASPIFF